MTSKGDEYWLFCPSCDCLLAYAGGYDLLRLHGLGGGALRNCNVT